MYPSSSEAGPSTASAEGLLPPPSNIFSPAAQSVAQANAQATEQNARDFLRSLDEFPPRLLSASHLGDVPPVYSELLVGDQLLQHTSQQHDQWLPQANLTLEQHAPKSFGLPQFQDVPSSARWLQSNQGPLRPLPEPSDTSLSTSSFSPWPTMRDDTTLPMLASSMASLSGQASVLPLPFSDGLELDHLSATQHNDVGQSSSHVDNLLQLCGDSEVDGASVEAMQTQSSTDAVSDMLEQDLVVTTASDAKRRLRSQRYRNRKRNRLCELKIETLDLHEKCLQLFQQQKVRYARLFELSTVPSHSPKSTPYFQASRDWNLAIQQVPIFPELCVHSIVPADLQSRTRGFLKLTLSCLTSGCQTRSEEGRETLP